MISPEKVEKALSLIAKGGAEYEYFFSNIKDVSWVVSLWDKGFFITAPPAHRSDQGEVIGAPFWPESKCLVRFSASHPELVLEIILAIETDNYHVINDFALAALEMPAEQAIKISTKIRRWLSSGNISHGQIEEASAKLSQKLCKEGHDREGIRLLTEIMRVLPDPEADEIKAMPVSDKVFGLLNRKPEPRIRFDSYLYKEILQEIVPGIFESSPFQVIQLLTRLIKDAVEFSLRDPDGSKPFDFLHISRNAIEKNNQHRGIDFEQNLISSLRDCCVRFSQENPNETASIIELLEKEEWSVFLRIALHVIGEVSSSPVHLVQERLINIDYFNNHHLWHEYYTLLQKRFNELTPEDQEQILVWIDTAESRSRLIDETSPDADPVQKEKWLRYWRYERLSAIHSYLSNEWSDRFHELQEEFGEPDMPFGYSSWSGSVKWGNSSPKTLEDLSLMTNVEIIAFLKSWLPPENRFEPSPGSLSSVLKGLAEKEPKRFIEDLKLFAEAGLDQTYFRGLLSGLLNSVLKTHPENAEILLDLCYETLDRNVVLEEMPFPAKTRDGFDADKGLYAIQSTIISFAEDLCDTKHDFPIDLRPKVWAIIEPLTHSEDPDAEYEEKHVGHSWDVLTMSLNTLRGKSLHAMMAYAMWVARHKQTQNAGRRPQLDDMPEVRAILESRLDLGSPFGSRQVDRAALGRWFYLMMSLDEEWVLAHLSDFFPSAHELRPLRMACFSTIVVYGGTVFGELLQIYHEEVELLNELELGEEAKHEFEKRLSEHVVLLYAWGKIGLEEGSLVDRFFSVAPPSLTGHVIQFLGHDMQRKSDEPVNVDVQERLKRLWDWRAEKCAGPSNIPDEELKAFGLWFAWGEYDPDWAFPSLEAAIRGPGLEYSGSYVFERLAEVFETCPAETLRITKFFIENNQDRWLLSGTKRKSIVWSLLEKAMKYPNADINQSARNIINLIGAQGYREFRDLLKISSDVDQ